ncbi:MAG: hypothetical protein RL095_3413 [Verrucomicrobiota bacterium]|jgi:cell division septum initiation protein DivIVA
MVILNRILNVLILLLAIFAAAASWLLHQRRAELRDRAELLQKTSIAALKSIEGTADDDAGWFGTSHASNFKKENLSWEKYHSAGKDTYEKKTLKELTDLADEVAAHRTKLADAATAYATTSRIFTEDADMKDKAGLLNSQYKKFDFDASKDIHPQVLTHITNHLAREDAFIAAIEKFGKSINKPVDTVAIGDPKSLGNKSYNTALDELNTNCGKLFTNRNALAEGFRAAVKAATSPRYNSQVNADLLISENPEDYNAAMADFVAKDIKHFNDELERLAQTLEKNERLQAEVADLSGRLEQSQAMVNDLKNKVGECNAEIARLTKKVDELEAALNVGDTVQLDAKIIANVLEVNEKYSFVVIDKGSEDDVKTRGIMLVHSNGRYLCKIKITRVLPHHSVAEILSETRADIPTIGDTCIVGR